MLQNNLLQIFDHILSVTQLVMGEGEEIHLLLGEALVLVNEEYVAEYCFKKQVGFIIQFSCVVEVTVRTYAEMVLTW